TANARVDRLLAAAARARDGRGHLVLAVSGQVRARARGLSGGDWCRGCEWDVERDLDVAASRRTVPCALAARAHMGSHPRFDRSPAPCGLRGADDTASGELDMHRPLRSEMLGQYSFRGSLSRSIDTADLLPQS